MNFKIVSDSSSNVFTFSGSGFEYETVPLKIITSKEEFVDTPDLDIPRMIISLSEEKNFSATSCPNMHEWYEAFKGADNIFAITITSSLSGSYGSAVSAAEEYVKDFPNANVYVIDSLSTGPEMQLIIEKLGELISSGKTFEEIKSEIIEYQKHSHLLFCLQSLANLARNGRVSHAAAKIAGILGIQIIGRASAQGTLELAHKLRGEKKVLNTIFKEMEMAGFSGVKVRISHCMNLAYVENLKSIILEKYPNCDVQILHCGALCSYYAERGGFIVGFDDYSA